MLGLVKNTMQPWLQQLEQDLAVTEDHFKELFSEDIPPWPIPFFGDIGNADILTVGVNPSWTEFKDNRWTGVTKASQVEARLLAYFKNAVPPDDWFATWEAALNHIDASYYGKAKYLAAHLDLSPRPTLPMSQIDVDPFFEMLMNDLFFLLFAFSIWPEHQARANGWEC